jgi:hypothetical protein
MNGREIALCLKSPLASDVLALALEGCFRDVRITQCGNVDEARRVLRRNPECCVLVEHDPAVPLAPFFRERAAVAKRSLVLLLGGDRSAGDGTPGLYFRPAKAPLRDLLVVLEDAFRIATLAEQYCRVSPQALSRSARPLPSDVFVRLNEGKYVKVMKAGDPFGHGELERFRTQKNIEHLYLPRAAFLELAELALTDTETILRDPAELSVGSAAFAALSVFEAVHALFEVDGFTPQAQKMAATAAELSVQILRKNPKLSELLARFDAERGTFLGWHSTALAFVACKLATALDWTSDASFRKLSLAATVHDLTLPRDELALHHDGCGPAGDALPAGDAARIGNHAREAADLVSGMSEVPGEVAFVVQQHHENGEGPDAVGPISALFIIAHDLVNAMYLGPPGAFRIDEYLARREGEKRFAKGAFGQVFRAIHAKVKELG